jgi:hypothetical protein
MVDIKEGLERMLDQPTESSRELRDEAKKYSGYAGMLTPMCKAYNTEMANEVANDGVQIHGGMGYMSEFDAERYYRDARITNIYEGTTQLQVVAAMGGIGKGTLSELIADFLAEHDLAGMSAELEAIKKMHDHFEKALQFVRDKKSSDFQTYHSRRVVEMACKILIAYLLAGDAARSERKKDVLSYYLEYAIPEVIMKAQMILSDATTFIEKRNAILDGAN